MLDRIGVEEFRERLQRTGVKYHVPTPDVRAGLAIGLGGGGISLADLTILYAALANGGRVRPFRILADEPISEGIPIMAEAPAWAVRDILAEMPEPEGFLHRTAQDGTKRIAYKTGTSYGFRDAWAVGIDADHTVGVWVGRADSAPNDGHTGATASAPLLFRVFDLLPRPRRGVVGAVPHETILSEPAEKLPERLKRVGEGFELSGQMRIAFPKTGTVVEISGCEVTVRVMGGTGPFRWLVNGKPMPSSQFERTYKLQTRVQGEVQLSVLDSSGATASTSFWLEAASRLHHRPNSNGTDHMAECPSPQ